MNQHVASGHRTGNTLERRGSQLLESRVEAAQQALELLQSMLAGC